MNKRLDYYYLPKKYWKLHLFRDTSCEKKFAEGAEFDMPS